MIICAAIKLTYKDNKTLIVYGRRHGDCFQIIKHLKDTNNIITKEQGFVDHVGNFLDRKLALEHAISCGQLTATTQWYKEDKKDCELYSEDLY